MKLRYLYILAGFLISTNIDIDDVYDDSWALIIGINNYDFIEDLNYSIDDASDIKNMLINDFDFPRENVVVLLDGDAGVYFVFMTVQSISQPTFRIPGNSYYFGKYTHFVY